MLLIMVSIIFGFGGTNNARDLISESTAFCFIVFLILLSEFVEVLRFRYASSRG
jgi:hypothetical protein